MPVERPRTFGKNERPLSSSQNSDQRFERGAVTAALGIDRNDVELREKPAEHRTVQQRFPGEKKNGAIGHAPGQWRVEKALMIRGENHRAVIDHSLGVNDAKPEENPAKQFDKAVTNPVIRIQSRYSISIPLIFNRPTISPTTPSIVRFELSMTCASSAIIKGEARREESARSRAAI